MKVIVNPSLALTEEERTMLRTYINFSDGSRMTVIELMSKFKSAYNTQIRNLRQASNEIKNEIKDEKK